MHTCSWISAFLALALSCSCSSAQTSKVTSTPLVSQYTKLTRPPCKTTSVQVEGANSEQDCPGVLGYKLTLLDSDQRMSVTVIGPDGGKHPLDFWNAVTSHFSSLGDVAEWRVREQGTSSSPVGVIVPLNVKEDPETNAITPYLVVAKIDGSKICVVEKIKQSKTAVAEARRIADSAAGRACQTQ